MKRLFHLFEHHTGIVSDYVRRQRGYVDPSPPPKKWYQKFWWALVGVFGIKEKPAPKPWYARSVAEVSIAFNEWRTGVWNRKRQIDGLRQRSHPFGDRASKHEIRKWIEERYGKVEA